MTAELPGSGLGYGAFVKKAISHSCSTASPSFQSIQHLPIFEHSHQNLVSTTHDSNKMATDALESLTTIENLSSTGRVSTDRMQERWAKDFLNGDFKRRWQEMLKITDPKESEKAVNWEGGASYEVCIALHLKKQYLLTRLLANRRFPRYYQSQLGRHRRQTACCWLRNIYGRCRTSLPLLRPGNYTSTQPIADPI